MDWTTAPIRIPNKPLLSLGEVVRCVGYSKRTIQRWVKGGHFPPPKSIAGGDHRWTAMSVGVWLAWQEYTCPPAAQPADDGEAEDGDDARPKEPVEADKKRPGRA